jgi:hypothetical protein
MGGPGQGYQVIASELDNAARIWDAQSSAVGSIAPKIEGMRLDHIDCGLFQLIVDPYDSVVDQVAGRCREGQTSMGDIASVLTTASADYKKAEQQNTSTVQGVH